MVQTLNQIENANDDYALPGVVPASWLTGRMMGRATIASDSRFADIYSAPWLSSLRERLQLEAVKLGLIKPPDNKFFDLSILLTNQRQLTQHAAKLIYEQEFDGVYYFSKHGADLENWALFERPEGGFGIVYEDQSHDILTGDADLQEAMDLFGLKLDLTR